MYDKNSVTRSVPVSALISLPDSPQAATELSHILTYKASNPQFYHIVATPARMSSTEKPSKPVAKPPPKPKNVKFSRALFPYASKEADELSFEEGDLLYIIDDTSDPDWWRAR